MDVANVLKKNLPFIHRYLFFGLLVVTSGLLWNTFHGDPAIYLCQTGFLQFNAREFSGVFTSPLWAILVYLFSTPLLFKSLGLIVSLVALVFLFFTVQHGEINETFAGCVVLPYLTFTLMGSETALAILLVILLYRGNRIAAYLLPFVRPEALLVTIFHSYRTKAPFWHLIPFFLWTVVLYIFGDGQSAAETRIADFPVYTLFRYSAVFVVYIVLWLTDRYRLPLYIVIPLSFLPMKELSWANAERKRGYDFETITMKEQAGYINKLLEHGETIVTREIQIRYWLRDDLKLQSLEGLVNTSQKPTWYLQSNRDGEGNNKVIGENVPMYLINRWMIEKAGFVEWFVLYKTGNVEQQ